MIYSKLRVAISRLTESNSFALKFYFEEWISIIHRILTFLKIVKIIRTIYTIEMNRFIAKCKFADHWSR